MFPFAQGGQDAADGYKSYRDTQRLLGKQGKGFKIFSDIK